MPDQEQITLKISAAEIELYCDELCRGSSNISRKHASLIALEGFITRHASTDKYSGPYHTILNTIQQYSEQTRTQLLKAYADELEVALSNEEPRELARIHESMSRNGYDRILDSALTHHAPEQLQSLKAWAGRWCQRLSSVHSTRAAIPMHSISRAQAYRLLNTAPCANSRGSSNHYEVPDNPFEPAALLSPGMGLRP